MQARRVYVLALHVLHVMPALVPGIHALLSAMISRRKTWMAGTSPAMTE
jgi:hypothetical protein